MEIEMLGNREAPALICVPGLLGGPEDFRGIVAHLEEHFCIIILDPQSERRAQGLANMTAEIMQDISFNSTSNDICKVLTKFGKEDAYLLGVSLGGKIIFDFAIKFPDRFLGGVVTDVGPGSFEKSELYQFVDKIVQETNLDLPWPELKLDLQKRIPDRSMRSLIQTQINYPDLKPPGKWKTAMRNFRTMLERQDIDDQFEGLMRVDQALINKKSTIRVLQASAFSGISKDSIPQMKALKSIEMLLIPETSHFLHVTHKETIKDEVMKLIRN